MRTEQFEKFRIQNLEKIRGGATITCKDRDGNNLGTVEHDCSGPGTALGSCINAYPAAVMAAGPC